MGLLHFRTGRLRLGFAQIPALDKNHEQYAQGSPSPGLAIYSKLDGDKLKAADVTEQYKDVYENNLKTGKYFLMTNFYSNPDVLISTNKAEVQQLVQGSITADQWAENIDAKMASAQ